MLMECGQFTTLRVTEFFDEELVCNPMSELLYTVYVDTGLTFFMIFVLVNSPESGLPIATCWMLKFTVFLGEVLPCKNLPFKINFGIDDHSWWTISSNDTCWYPAKSLVCTWPCATSAAAMYNFPMIIDLSAYSNIGNKGNNVMVRCMSVPKRIERLVTLTG